MPCFHPLHGYKARSVNPTGKRSVVFNVRAGYRDLPVTVPCGRCIGCRLERSRQWAVRCMHEAELSEENAFLTLTYDDEHLPGRFLLGYDPRTGAPVYGGTVVKKHFQDFMKRLRKKAGRRIKFFHCGEYGEQYGRPHYHACIFGFDFPDKIFFKEKNGHRLYRSAVLERLWPFGSSLIGAVAFESAAYVARYCLKKMTGALAKRHYERCDLDSGEIVSLTPEYVTMSLRPAIARDWLERYMGETYTSDSVVVRGMEMKPPKYYDKRFEILDAEAMELVKHRRRVAAGKIKVKKNSTPERLAVREVVKSAQLTQLRREIE